MTMETPKENTEVKTEPKVEEAKVEIIADGKVITPKKEDLRINIMLKDGHIFIGAQANDTDPKMTTLQGDLTAALARVPEFIAECNAQWDLAKHNPKAPEPVKPPLPPRTATTSSTASKPASKPAAAQTQKLLF